MTILIKHSRGYVSSRVKGSRCIVMAVMFLIR
jgi:hypothetical protein